MLFSVYLLSKIVWTVWERNSIFLLLLSFPDNKCGSPLTLHYQILSFFLLLSDIVVSILVTRRLHSRTGCTVLKLTEVLSKRLIHSTTLIIIVLIFKWDCIFILTHTKHILNRDMNHVTFVCTSFIFDYNHNKSFNTKS